MGYKLVGGLGAPKSAECVPLLLLNALHASHVLQHAFLTHYPTP